MTPYYILFSSLLQLPEPFSFIFTWFAAVPLLVWLALSLTNVIVKDSLILKVGLNHNLSLTFSAIFIVEQYLKIIENCRVLAPTAARRTSPSLAPYCPSLAVVQLTISNAQSEKKFSRPESFFYRIFQSILHCFSD